jgi:RNA 2',3'-cyclic 3'-phosphodiesterase
MYQDSFDFIEEQPRRPQRPERLFLGCFPEERVWSAIRHLGEQTANEFDLTGNLLADDRFHTSLVHISDRKWLRSRDQFAAERAAATVRITPFEISYSRLGSFPGVPKKGRPLEHPLVLLADEGPVMKLQAALASGLRQFQYHVPDSFRPHLTVSYNRQFLPAREIEPITFVVREFVLVHSRLWLTEYRILKTWPLH